MKKFMPWLIIIIVIIAIGAFIFSAYNGIAVSREAVDTQQANIDSQLQRRSDLIPNLMSTVKGFAQQEKDVIASVTEARSKLAGAQTMPQKAEADTALSGALSRLLMVVENYPTLKSDATFISLMDELSGTENRIAVARNDYNQSVKEYNSLIIKFPAKIIASVFGFDKAEYFQASDAAQSVPEVDFTK
ncbi:MAG: LemA family protein [Clostridiales bacterium]